jgi:sulfite reductase (NADPH) flavoprotein alpha-component
MTLTELTPLALTEGQWAKLNELAISLKPGQALWISGYFAGLGRAYALEEGAAPVIPYGALGATPATAPRQRLLTILVGSETGNSAALARKLGEQARGQGLESVIADMADYKTRRLKDEQDLVIITSTHGEGDPPRSALGFFEFIEGRKAPRLPDLRYAVLALGDSTYERYCEAGKRLDRRLSELGATEIQPRADCDVDYDEPATGWIKTLLPRLASKPPSTTAAVAGVPRMPAQEKPGTIDKHHPFPAAILENIVLTGRGSSKETRHLELSLADSGLAFEPGDALGILPRNDPRLVEDIAEAVSLRLETPLVVKDEKTTLGAALGAAFEITASTPRFIDYWAGVSGATDLKELLPEDRHEARATFMRSHHLIDVLRQFPVGGVDPQAFVKALRPLQPRLYSIASSLAAAPDEAHITVSAVRYALNDIARSGVASGYLAEHASPDVPVDVYIQPNPHFRLADDETPIIMIGAGTGIAPYRAFMQEREARGAAGRSWLFLGERNFHTDFLYQTEWHDFLKEGILTRMDVAFSRDRAEKVYVQHRLRERARDVYAWVEEGASIYVCGDAEYLAPDVHAALIAIVQEQRGMRREAAIEYLGVLQSDHRYQIDVY